MKTWVWADMWERGYDLAEWMVEVATVVGVTPFLYVC